MKKRKFTYLLLKFPADLIIIFSVLFIFEEPDEFRKRSMNAALNYSNTCLNSYGAVLCKKDSVNRTGKISSVSGKKSIASFELRSIIILINNSMYVRNSGNYIENIFADLSYLKQLQISQMRC